MNDLGLSCFDVEEQYEKHKRPALSSFSIGSEQFNGDGLHHLIIDDESFLLEVSKACQQHDIPMCAINTPSDFNVPNVINIAHMDGLTSFITLIEKTIDTVVIAIARTLVESFELESDKALAKSGIVRHVRHLEQTAAYYGMRIILINTREDGQVYIDDVMSKIEKSRVYLP